jgi:hypothetical protein
MDAPNGRDIRTDTRVVVGPPATRWGGYILYGVYNNGDDYAAPEVGDPGVYFTYYNTDATQTVKRLELQETTVLKTVWWNGEKWDDTPENLIQPGWTCDLTYDDSDRSYVDCSFDIS